MAQPLKAQQPSKRKSGTKALRRFEYNPPLAAVQEVHQVDVDEAGRPETEADEEDEEVYFLPDTVLTSPVPPVIVITPNTPKGKKCPFSHTVTLSRQNI